MAVFRVWAPHAHAVRVVTVDQQAAMSPDRARGWWTADVPAAGPGDDYAFSIDGGEPLPDPRSPWQPEGPHGRSRIVDHGEFKWTDSWWRAPPLSSAILYELHIGTFTPGGTFDSAIECLDHLVDLGVTDVELMPVNEFPGSRGWGYDGVALFAPYHAYGGPDGLKRLVDACHSRGLAVILDVVYNHLGPDGNYLGRFGPYFTSRHTTPWGEALNLDGACSDEVRRFFCDNALMWLRDYHMDGLRIDAVHAILDASAVHLLEQMATETRALEAAVGRPLRLIAESDLNDPRVVRPPEAGGYGIDAQWSDDLHHALHAALTGDRQGYYQDFGRLGDIARALTNVFVYDGRHSEYRRRRHGRPATGLPGARFLAYLQNHDQVGNRATGERSSMLMSTGRLKIGAALVTTSPFIPMLFQGEEWGASTPFQYFTDHADPDLGKAVTEGRRSEFSAFGWDPEGVPDPQAESTFHRSRLDWAEASKEPHADLLEWHRNLVRLRRETPDLCDGRIDRVQVQVDEAQQWLRLRRGRVTVACNLAAVERRMEVGPDAGRIALASDPDIVLDGAAVTLPPDSVAVLA